MNERKDVVERVLLLSVATLCASCQFDTSPLAGFGASQAPTTGENPQAEVAPNSGVPDHRLQPRVTARMDSTIGSASELETLDRDGGPIAELRDSAAADASTSANLEASQRTDAAGEPIDDAGEAGQPTAAPGSPFTACSSSAVCQSGLVCSVDSALGFPATEPGYCTAPCGLANLTADCPQPISGMVQATCMGTLCVLGSCERAMCPRGMSCAQTEIPVVPGAVAYLFECKP